MPNIKYNWPQLFADYEQSGLSQTEFCKQHGINPKYFSLKLSKRKASESSPFAKAIVQPEVEYTTSLVL
ncbi:IS66 family insertion sequence element accessory protein TnpA, partial [Teredinibacter turnerae]|uniref:IS66 family insertion sequence element accessory protein TnpA n=1 Tax=Teredinibacter turnerae TaxID=2426 RepID=UPI00036AAD34